MPSRPSSRSHFRALPVILALGIAGCDSTTSYTADLGQSGPLPSIQAVAAAPAANASVQMFTFKAPTGGSLPASWQSAQSLKVQISGTMIPMSAGAPGSYVAAVPLTLGYVPPLAGAGNPMVFEVNNDHVMVAEVSF